VLGGEEEGVNDPITKAIADVAAKLLLDRRERARSLPICDVCNRPVDAFEEIHEDFIDKVIFTARCHGQTERVSVSTSELCGSITLGRAFVASKMLAP
jgi:hypothetical protein